MVTVILSVRLVVIGHWLREERRVFPFQEMPDLTGLAPLDNTRWKPLERHDLEPRGMPRVSLPTKRGAYAGIPEPPQSFFLGEIQA